MVKAKKGLIVTTKKLLGLEERVKMYPSSPAIDTLRQDLRALRDQYAAPVEAALAAVNGRCESFAVTSYLDVLALAKSAEDRLASRGVPMSHRVGSTLHYRPAGPTANAYKYSAASTYVVLERVRDGWRLMEVRKDSVHPRQSALFVLYVTADAHASIISWAVAGAGIRLKHSQALEPAC